VQLSFNCTIPRLDKNDVEDIHVSQLFQVFKNKHYKNVGVIKSVAPTNSLSFKLYRQQLCGREETTLVYLLCQYSGEDEEPYFC
jgi:hypothetical protein